MDHNEIEEEDDDFGPSLPPTNQRQSALPSTSRDKGQGPSIPTRTDLLAHHEELAEAAARDRQIAHADLQDSRRLDRKTQRSRLDDLTPRAEAGTHERRVENKRLVADSNRSFAVSAHEAGDADLRDADVMGDDDSLGELKKMKIEQARKKNEREIRKEEMLRARRAEREIKLAGLREKENKTMDMLKEIARARFGVGEEEEVHRTLN
jgi:hypothetical protein